MTLLKASMMCRSKSSVCLAMRSAVFIKFLPAKAAQCRIEHPVHFTSYDPYREGIQRVMRAAPRARSARKTEEVHLIDGMQNLDECGLDDLVVQRRDASRSLPPIGFWDVRPPRGLRSVCASLEPLGKVLEVCLQVFAVLLPRHPIDTGGRLRIQAEVGSPQGL